MGSVRQASQGAISMPKLLFLIGKLLSSSSSSLPGVGMSWSRQLTYFCFIPHELTREQRILFFSSHSFTCKILRQFLAYSTLISCLPIHQSQNKVTAVGDLGQPERVVIGRLLFLKSSRQMLFLVHTWFSSY